MTETSPKARKWASKEKVLSQSEKNNPCLKEQQLSFKCLDDNKYDKELCSSYFDNYNVCKKFWDMVSMDRRKKGIVPHLPNVEDREKVKTEYLKFS